MIFFEKHSDAKFLYAKICKNIENKFLNKFSTFLRLRFLICMTMKFYQRKIIAPFKLEFYQTYSAPINFVLNLQYVRDMVWSSELAILRFYIKAQVC